jgi:hypothetical protein
MTFVVSITCVFKKNRLSRLSENIICTVASVVLIIVLLVTKRLCIGVGFCGKFFSQTSTNVCDNQKPTFIV